MNICCLKDNTGFSQSNMDVSPSGQISSSLRHSQEAVIAFRHGPQEERLLSCLNRLRGETLTGLAAGSPQSSSGVQSNQDETRLSSSDSSASLQRLITGWGSWVSAYKFRSDSAAEKASFKQFGANSDPYPEGVLLCSSQYLRVEFCCWSCT